MRARAEIPLAAWGSTAPDDAAVGQSLDSRVLYAESFVVRGWSPFRDAMLDHGEPMLLDPETGPRTEGEIAVDVQQQRKRFAGGAAGKSCARPSGTSASPAPTRPDPRC